MAITLTVRGTSYTFPQVDDEDWGAQVTLWAEAITSVVLPLAEAPATPTASDGVLRLGNGDKIAWRDNSNTNDAGLYLNNLNKLIMDLPDGSNIDLSEVGTGDVHGPSSSVDNSLPRFDLTTGKIIQGSNVIVSDLDNVSGINALTAASLVGPLTGNSAGTHVGPVTGDLTGNSSGIHTGNVVATLANLTTANVGTLIATTIGAATANVAAAARTRATGTSVAAGGVAISTSSGTSESGTDTSFVDVSNVSVTIVTSGRPVMLILASASASGPGYLAGYDNSGTYCKTLFKLVRGSTSICETQLGATATGATAVVASVPGFSFVDTPSAGTYTYKLQAAADAGAGAVWQVYKMKLIAFEL